MPPLGGLVVTRMRPDTDARLLLDSPEGHPVLATWQAGLGRVAAFTSDAHANWAEAWLDWPGYRRLWTTLTRATARPAGRRDFDLDAVIRDGRLAIRLLAAPDDEADEADAAAGAYLAVPGVVSRPDGEAVEVRLRQVGPDTYETSLPADESGHYVVALTPRRGTESLGVVLGGVSQNAGAEFRHLSSNAALLERIRETTGGRNLDPSAPQEADLSRRADLPPPVSVIPRWPPLLALAMLLFLLDVAARRIAWSRAGLEARWQEFREVVRLGATNRADEVGRTLESLRNRPGDRRVVTATSAEGKPAGEGPGRETAGRGGAPLRPADAAAPVRRREARDASESDAEAEREAAAPDRDPEAEARERARRRRAALGALSGRRSAPEESSHASPAGPEEPSDAAGAGDGDGDADDAMDSVASRLAASRRRRRDRGQD